MTSSLTSLRSLFIGLASTALVAACAPQDLTSAESRDDGAIGSATLALGSPPNLAFGKPAFQSSTSHDAAASRAVDGNTDGAFGNNSVTHTEHSFQPWWQVDLQGVHAISSVVVHNRTDCCAERLQDFRVRVSDDGVSWQDFPFVGTAPAQSTFAINRPARYVRVQLDGANPLSLAEVQVFGVPPPPTPPTELLVSVEPAGCGTVAINSAIGQSFRVNRAAGLEKLEVWINPELYRTTSYGLEVYVGEGTTGVKLATSQTTLTLHSTTAGTQAAFYGFSFTHQDITLQPDHAYTFKLVRLSQYSGSISDCADIYPHGMQYWLGTSSERYRDMAFKLYGS